jgi:cytochrome b
MVVSTRRISVWDPFIRIFHWSLVILVLSNIFITEEGEGLHEVFGYICSALVALRVIWGFVGPHNARFSSFFPTATRVKQHIDAMKTGEFDPKEGHNPLGGAMIFVLMALIIGLAATGFMMEEVDFFFGEEWVEEFHEALSATLQLMVVIHISAVIAVQQRSGISLVKPMITGKRDLD